MDIREAEDEDLLDALKDRGYSEEFINILKDRSIDARSIDKFSDTELNNELSRRRQIHEKQYEKMMEGGK